LEVSFVLPEGGTRGGLGKAPFDNGPLAGFRPFPLVSLGWAGNSLLKWRNVINAEAEKSKAVDRLDIETAIQGPKIKTLPGPGLAGFSYRL